MPDLTRVFIVKRFDEDEFQLLVEEKESWGCFFLPYVKKEVSEEDFLDNAAIKSAIANKVGLSASSVNIVYLKGFDHNSEKHDPPQNVVKEYRFEFYYLTSKERLKIENFTVGDRNYSWKTLNELESHENTLEKNSDVLHHLRSNYVKLVDGVAEYEL